MSGALDNTGSDRTFVNTFKGRFTIRANAETEGAIERVNKNGKTVHELHYDQLSDVYIQKFEKRHDEEYGFSWNIYLAHAKSDSLYKLTLPYSGRITMGIFLRLPNIDINKPMNLKMYYFEEEDKSALVVYQEGGKIEPYWTKEDKKGLPELKDLGIVNGKQAWGSDDRMAFLEKYIKETVEPKMNDLDLGVVAEEEVVDSASPEDNEPVWDADAKVLKKKHTDGKFYECDEAGKFKRDQEGKMIDALPF